MRQVEQMSEREEREWQALEDRAADLTNQNRAALAKAVIKDRDLFIKAFVDWLESGSPVLDEIAGLLWNERQYELSSIGESKGLDGCRIIDKTDLALWFRDCAYRWARDNAEIVTPEELDQQLRDQAAINHALDRSDK